MFSNFESAFVVSKIWFTPLDNNGGLNNIVGTRKIKNPLWKTIYNIHIIQYIQIFCINFWYHNMNHQKSKLRNYFQQTIYCTHTYYISALIYKVTNKIFPRCNRNEIQTNVTNLIQFCNWKVNHFNSNKWTKRTVKNSIQRSIFSFK